MTVARWATLALTLTPFIVLAGRPLTTDDAATLEHGQCQVEAWIDRSRDVALGWFVPACNFGLGIEWQVGFARSRELGVEHLAEGYFQAKKTLRAPREGSPWSAGITVGVTRRPLSETHRRWEHPYVIVPVTIASGDLTLHASPGWARNRETGRDLTLWGAALEWAAHERFDLVAEAFGEGSVDPFGRAGIRWAAIKDRLWIDLTQVARVGGARNDRFTSLGLTWVISILP